MPSRAKRLFASINYFRTLPVFLCVLFSKQKQLIKEDVARWKEIDGVDLCFFETINWYLTYKKELRNLLQHRFKNPARSFSCFVHYFIARLLWKPLETLYILELYFIT